MTTSQIGHRSGSVLEGLVDSSAVSSAQVAMGRRLCRIAGFRHESTLLATVLAFDATMCGSVCVNLESVAQDYVVPDLAMQWPDTQEWCRELTEDLARAGVDSPLVLDGLDLYLERYWRHEEHLVRELARRHGDPTQSPTAHTVLPVAEEPATPLDDKQQLAVEYAGTRQLTVIAGGPGTGKTTVISRIFALLSQLHRPDGRRLEVALTAPTGRAAVRLREELQNHATHDSLPPNVSNALREARPVTLHRLLGWQPSNRSRFRFNATNPLPFDAVIVDECSMVGLALMDQLIDAMTPSAKLVLVGDQRQLASVEAGSFFGDIVAAYGGQSQLGGVVELDRVHRHGREISDLANGILLGDVDAVKVMLDGPNECLSWIPVSAVSLSPEHRAQILKPGMETWRELRVRAESGLTREALELSTGVRILCGPRHGPFGVSNWNRHAHEGVNSGGDVNDWFPGRPVLVGKNDHQLDIFNGDVGVAMGGGDPRASYVAFDRAGSPLIVATHRLGDVDTAYASTVHKSQGSQFRDVIVVLPPPGSRLMTRELLYTAVTRAKERVTIIGDEASLHDAVATRTHRHSGLQRKLAKGRSD